MRITGSPTSPEGGIWEVREVIQIGDTLKVAVFHCYTRFTYIYKRRYSVPVQNHFAT